MSQELGAKVQKSLAQANDVATETFSSMKTVRSFANEEGETERYRKRLEKTYSLNKEEAAAYAASTWTNSVSLSFNCKRSQGESNLSKFSSKELGLHIDS